MLVRNGFFYFIFALALAGSCEAQTGVSHTVTPSTCTSTGPQRIAVLVATYPTTHSPSPDLAYLQELFLGLPTARAPSIADYYASVTGEKLSFSAIDFFGPYSFSLPYTVDSSQVNMQGQGIFDYDRAILALAQGAVDLNHYDRLVIIRPEALDAKTGQTINMMGGLSSVNCSETFSDGRISKKMGVSWIPAAQNLTGARAERAASASIWNRWSAAQKTDALRQLKTADMRSIIHEIGHTFGLGHANAIASTKEVLPSESTPLQCRFYADFYDVMGDSVSAPLSIPHRASLNWLSPSELQTVTQSGTYRIYPFGASFGRLSGLKIARGQSKEEKDDEDNEGDDASIWVEYRNGKSLYERSSELEKTLAYDGALVHYTNSKRIYASKDFHWPNETLLLDFKPGATNFDTWITGQVLKGRWKDPYSSVAIEVIQATPDYLDVNITFSPLGI